ncbi:uncharacterized protein SPSK_05753 [Sporothrix schenckii 1099-18]|uniref:Uncharacterized protein n=1 Tax=Sporothrix schenckii 1099-18 TaxID=1397361 RepID=A0A0F2LUP2_SPOSC|nr:uncharacterized protein SPSK_05753 [Sporothrix schenckii 1099-18]KJR80559.1 hypothetical protein SPSK_05753 [Sporothrix schenckii 1099-18]
MSSNRGMRETGATCDFTRAEVVDSWEDSESDDEEADERTPASCASVPVVSAEPAEGWLQAVLLDFEMLLKQFEEKFRNVWP